MMNNNLKSLCQSTIPIIKKTAQFLQSELGKVTSQQIETKALNSLVSYVDKTAENQLVNGLRDLLPGAVFLTEEDTVENQSGEWQWIIDPLDGTTNFLHQLPFFSVSVALRHRDEVVIGIVMDVMHDDCYYAWKGGGAWRNDQSIAVTQTQQLSDTLIATGFPYYDFSQMSNYMKTLEQLMQKTRGLRRFGSAALDLAYTACGRFDAFFEYSLQPWDVAAGVLLVTEAGGKVSAINEGKDYLFDGELVAGNDDICRELILLLTK